MNAACVLITPELLVQVLKLPSGTKMSAASMTDGPEGCYVRVTLEHPDLPLVVDGELAKANPCFHRYDDKTEPLVEFVSWGLK